MTQRWDSQFNFNRPKKRSDKPPQRTPYRRWTEAASTQLTELLEAGVSVAEAAREMNRPAQTVYFHATRLGLKK